MFRINIVQVKLAFIPGVSPLVSTKPQKLTWTSQQRILSLTQSRQLFVDQKYDSHVATKYFVLKLNVLSDSLFHHVTRFFFFFLNLCISEACCFEFQKVQKCQDGLDLKSVQFNSLENSQ